MIISKERYIFFISIILLFAFYCTSFSQETRMRVIKEGALLKLNPDFNSPTILNVPLGSILNMVEAVGDWIKVMLPPNENKIKIEGYIHSSYVEPEQPSKLPEETNLRANAAKPQPIQSIEKRNTVETASVINKEYQ